jgi:hypothetical protein
MLARDDVHPAIVNLLLELSATSTTSMSSSCLHG